MLLESKNNNKIQPGFQGIQGIYIDSRSLLESQESININNQVYINYIAYNNITGIYNYISKQGKNLLNSQLILGVYY